MSGVETTKAIQSVANAFDLIDQKGTNAGQSISHIGDVITAVSKNMAYDFSDGIVQLTSAVRTSGSVAKESGMSLEQYTAYMGAMIEATGKSGDEVATFWKMLTARVQQVKRVADEEGVTLADMGKAEKALHLVGVEVRKGNGDLKDMDTVLQELSPIWSTLTDEQRAFTAESVAGNRHRASFLSLMKAITKEQSLYNDALNSNGELEKVNQVKAESIEGKINTLQTAFHELASKIGSSDMFKGIIDGATSVIGVFDKLVNSIGALPTILATATLGLSLFSNKFKSFMADKTSGIMDKVNAKANGWKDSLANSYVENQGKYESTKKIAQAMKENGQNTVFATSKLLGYKMCAIGATVAERGLTIATQALGVALNVALGLGIGLAIQGIMNLINHEEMAKQKNEELMASMQSLKGNIDSISTLKDSYINLKAELEKGGLSVEQMASKKEELSSVYSQLIQQVPELEGVLNNESLTYQEQGKAIQNVIDLKKQELALKSEKYFQENKTSDSKINDMIEKMKKYQQEAKNLAKTATMSDEEFRQKGGVGKNFDRERSVAKDGELDAKQKFLDLNSQLGEIMTNYEILKKMELPSYISSESINNIKEFQESLNLSGGTLNTISQLSEKTKNTINSNTSSIKQFSEEAEKNNGKISDSSIKKLNEQFPELKINADNATSYLAKFNQQIDESTKTSQAYTNMKMLRDAIDDLHKNGQLSSESLGLLSNKMPELELNGKSATEQMEQLNTQLEKQNELAGKTTVTSATQSYGEAVDKVIQIQGLINKINEEHKMTPQLIAQIAQAYPQVGASVSNAQSCVEALNHLIDGQVDKQKEAYMTMVGDDIDYYASKVANNSEYAKSINDFLNQFVTQSGEAYNINLKDYTTLNQMKEEVQNKFGEAINQWLSQFVESNGKGYLVDLENFKDAAKAKAMVLQKLQEEIKKVNAQMGAAAMQQLENQKLNDATAQFAQNAGIDYDPTKSLQGMQNGFLDEKIAGYKAKIDELNGAVADVDTQFEQFGSTLRGFDGSIGSSGAIGGGDVGSGDSGKGKKGGKSDAEKLADELERLNKDIKIDRYLDLKNVLSDVENELTENKNAQSVLTGSALDAKLQEEVVLINKKKNALEDLNNEQKKESEELRSYLSQYGFYFDETGKLINSQQRLLEIQSSINEMTDPKQKKEWGDWLDELNDKTKNYCDLTIDKIPKCTEEWKQLERQIKQTSKTMLEDLRNDLIEALKKEQEKVMKEKLKALEDDHNAEMDSFDQEIKNLQEKIDKKKEELKALDDSKDENEKKLAKLKKQLALWKQDDSVFSTKKQQDLMLKIAELEKELKKESMQEKVDSLEKEKDLINDQKEEAKKNYDQQVQDIKDYYADAQREHEIYAKANKMITENNMQEIEKLLMEHSEKWKEIGTLLSTSFTDAVNTQIKNGLGGFNNLIGKSDDYTFSSNNDIISNKGEKPHKEYWQLEEGDSVWIRYPKTPVFSDPQTGETTGETWWESGVGSADQEWIINYNNGYVELAKSKNGKGIGWIPRDLLAQYDTGGYVPDNISRNGALSIVDRGEKILNREQTKRQDAMENFVMTFAPLLKQFDIQSKLPKTNSGVVNNNNTSSSKSIEMKNTFQITNNNVQDSYLNHKNVDRYLKQQIKKFG